MIENRLEDIAPVRRQGGAVLVASKVAGWYRGAHRTSDAPRAIRERPLRRARPVQDAVRAWWRA